MKPPVATNDAASKISWRRLTEWLRLRVLPVLVAITRLNCIQGIGIGLIKYFDELAVGIGLPFAGLAGQAPSKRVFVRQYFDAGAFSFDYFDSRKQIRI